MLRDELVALLLLNKRDKSDKLMTLTLIKIEKYVKVPLPFTLKIQVFEIFSYTDISSISTEYLH